MERLAISTGEIAQRRVDHRQQPVRQVAFRVAGLYGLSPHSISMPLNKRESIESGQICITLDPEADPTSNVGIIDYERGKLTVCYGIHAVFPGLFELITSGNYDRSLLNPVRAVATDQCTLTEDRAGWHALGCLDFLPGSYWAGAEGG